MGLFSKVKNIAFGSKDKGVADRYVELDKSLKKSTEAGRKAQQVGLAGLQKSATDIGGEIAAKQRMARQAGVDTSRRLQDMVAQRGLQGSSVGLGQELAAQQRTAQKLAEIKGSEAALKRRGLSSLISAAGNVLGNQGAQKTLIQGRRGTGRRSGGLYKAAATGVGAAFLGPGGAEAGAGWGDAVANFGN